MYPTRLLVLVSCAAALMGLLLPGYNLLLLQPAVEESMRRAAVTDAARLSEHLLAMEIPESFAFTSESVTSSLEARLQQLATDFELARLRIYDATGRVLYSSDAREEGQVNTHPYFQGKVAAGEVYAELVTQAEQLEVERSVVETYVPVMRDGRFRGAFDISYDVSARMQYLSTVLRHSSWMIAGVSLAFLLLVFILLRRYLHLVTAQMRSEEAQRNQAKLLETLIGAIPAPIFFKDSEGIYRGCNPAFEAYIGRDRDHVVGRTVYDVAPKNLAEVYHKADLELMAQGDVQVYEAKVQYADGTLHDVRFHKAPFYQEDGTVGGLVGAMIDVTDIREAERQLNQMAYYDRLTGLPNRALLRDRLEQAMQLAGREGHQAALILLDLDDFKELNDSLGHGAGDEYLQHVAGLLAATVQSGDTVARLGGDEFAVLLPEVVDASRVSGLVDRLLLALTRPWNSADHQFATSASLGVVLYPVDGTTATDLLKHADMAMFAAKEQGGGNACFFTAELNLQAAERRAVKASLELAFERDELRLYYQPQVEGASGTVCGVEALVRWQHPTEGLLTPLRFIPLAEESGQIDRLGQWVLREACRQARAWQDQGLPPVPVAVNVSSRQLKDPGFAPKVASILEQTGLAPRLLELELTESLLMEDTELTIGQLERLKDLGVKLAVDDFGTGYSSLSYLKHLPLDRVKIDLSFIRDIDQDADSAAIVDAIVALSRSLGLQCLAEGVERDAQRVQLLDRGCPLMQGYLFSRPVAAEMLADAWGVVADRLVLPRKEQGGR